MGRAVLIAIGFVSYPLFTRLLPVEQYGLMGLASTVILTVSTFSKLGMQHALQRFHKERRLEGGLRLYFSTLFNGAVGGALIVTAIYLGVLYTLPGDVLDRTRRDVLVAASLLILIRTVQSMVTNWLLIEGRTVLLNALEIVSRCLLIVTMAALFLRWQRTAFAFVIGSSAVEACILFGTLHYIVHRDVLSLAEFDRREWGEALSFAFPMIAAELGAVLLAFGDRFLISAFLSPNELGYYTAAYGLAQYTWELMTIPISTVFFPICMASWTEKGPDATRQLLSSSLRLFFAPAFGLLASVVLCSRDGIVILASAKYGPAAHLLPILVAGMIAGALPVFFRSGLLIMKKPSWVAGITACGLIVNIAANLLLIPRMGILGAAIATLVSYLAQAGLAATFSLRVLPFDVPYRAAALYLACAGVTIAVGYYVRYSNPLIEFLLRVTVCLLYPLLLLGLDCRLRSVIASWVSAPLRTSTSTSSPE